MTSGGDAPGMNAAIRSVVRAGVYNGIMVYGVMRGYEGLIDDDIVPMDARSVSNILSRGGTMLKTSRSKRFFKKETRETAGYNLKRRGIGGLIIIGGNGSFRGADLLARESGIPIVGIPGTIDNDICGSDFTIGAETAVGTALDAIDKIRDTVTSMERIYVVEVMGRDEPFIAIRVGIAGGAEDIVFPGKKLNIKKMCDDIKKGHKRGKISWIIVVSEGAAKAKDVAKRIKKKTGFEVREVTLGHIQRGGSPFAFDRVLGTRLGAASVEKLLKSKKSGMVGVVSSKLTFVDFKTACRHDKDKMKLDKELYGLTEIMAI
jgi:6-phosphofructokinase 1